MFISTKKLTPDQEVKAVVRSLKGWFPHNPQQTVAVLVPRNERGARLVNELKNSGLEVVELLRSTLATRTVAGTLAAILHTLADPISAPRLATVYHQLRQQQEAHKTRVAACHDLLRRCTQIEDYLYPRPGRDWLSNLEAEDCQPEVLDELRWLRQQVVRWQEATLLPIDQLILTISQEIFTQPADLALAHKLALILERAERLHPDWRLFEFSHELESVAHNRRKLIGFSDDDTGFDPDRHCGKVVVATVHKAKGLEWDRVYLMSVNNYDFPSADEIDTFISEKWFVRDRLNLQAECLSRLKALVAGDLTGLYAEEGVATVESRLDYAAERLRLLYVGITRARKELIITWNSGRQGESVQALPLMALQTYLEQNRDATES